MFRGLVLLFLTLLWNGQIAAGLSAAAGGSTLKSFLVDSGAKVSSRSEGKQPACTSAQVSERSAHAQKISTVREVSSLEFGRGGGFTRARSLAFERDVRAKGVPVLIKGTHAPTLKSSFWDAMTKVPGTPVPSRNLHVKSKAESKQVFKQRAARQPWRRKITNVSWKSFRQQIEDFEAQAAASLEQGSDTATTRSPLYAKLEHIPKEMQDIGYKGLSFYMPSHGPHYMKSKLWVGSQGAVTPLHEDPVDNVAVQLTGRKRWHLFSPDHFNELGYLGFSEPWDYQRGHCSFNAKKSGVRWSKYHMLTTQDMPPVKSHLVVDVEPGDSLYIPSFWGHMVESLDTSIMANYWFPDMWTCCNGGDVEGAVVGETPV